MFHHNYNVSLTHSTLHKYKDKGKDKDKDKDKDKAYFGARHHSALISPDYAWPYAQNLPQIAPRSFLAEPTLFTHLLFVCSETIFFLPF